MNQNEPSAMKEIHAIRIDNYKRTKELSPEDRSRRRSETVRPIAERYGFRIVPAQKSEPPPRTAE